MCYPLGSNTVTDFDEFSRIIADYYNHHYTSCVSHGGRLAFSEAAGRAKEILENEYRKRGGNIVSAYNNAQDGTNGGMRVVLDTIAEGLKVESVQRYTREAFDRHVAPNSWVDQVEIVREFIAWCGNMFSSSLGDGQPESCAHNYNELIMSHVEGLQRTSSIFRRI